MFSSLQQGHRHKTDYLVAVAVKERLHDLVFSSRYSATSPVVVFSSS
jgi:hypothetical protein